jgi:hypothetical protein
MLNCNFLLNLTNFMGSGDPDRGRDLPTAQLPATGERTVLSRLVQQAAGQSYEGGGGFARGF